MEIFRIWIFQAFCHGGFSYCTDDLTEKNLPLMLVFNHKMHGVILFKKYYTFSENSLSLEIF
jgi:hypothetical protein